MLDKHNGNGTTEKPTLTRHQIYRRIRKQRGAMAELARELGLSRATISQVLRGRVPNPNAPFALRILAAARQKIASPQNTEDVEGQSHD